MCVFKKPHKIANFHFSFANQINHKSMIVYHRRSPRSRRTRILIGFYEYGCKTRQRSSTLAHIRGFVACCPLNLGHPIRHQFNTHLLRKNSPRVAAGGCVCTALSIMMSFYCLLRHPGGVWRGDCPHFRKVVAKFRIQIA